MTIAQAALMVLTIADLATLVRFYQIRDRRLRNDRMMRSLVVAIQRGIGG